MPSSPPVALTEDQIDDLLYLSRANESSELLSEIASLKQSLSTPAHAATEADIILSAVDPESGNNVLHMAAANGHVGILNSLMPFLPSTKHTYIPSTTTPHPSLSHKNSSGNTPLHWACLNGHLEAVKVLVEVGKADPAVVNGVGKDAVFEAEVGGHGEVVEWLLRNCEGLEGAVGVGEGEGEGEGEGGEEMNEPGKGEEKGGREKGKERMEVDG